VLDFLTRRRAADELSAPLIVVVPREVTTVVAVCVMVMGLAMVGQTKPFPLFWHHGGAKAALVSSLSAVLARVEGVSDRPADVQRAARDLVRLVPFLLAQGVAVDEVFPREAAEQVRRLIAWGRAPEAAARLREAARGLRERFERLARPHAEVGTISGTVLTEEGAPIAGAKVFVLGREDQAVTDKEGRFRLEHVPVAGPRYLIVAQAPGYLETYAGNLSVTPGKEKRLTLRMLKLTAERSQYQGNLAVKIGYVLQRRSSGPPRQPASEAVISPDLYPARVRVYLQPSRAIDSDNARVKAIANEILASLPADARTSATRVAKAVYDWVVRNIRYDLMVNYPGDPTCGNWQTTFGAWGRNFGDWCYTASQVLEQRRAICIEFERLSSALLRALSIPARPAPLMAHPVTQWWVQLPDGRGYWCNFESSAGSTAFHKRGDLWARFPGVPDQAIAFWSPDASAPIHMQWDAGRDCLWLEDYGKSLIFELSTGGKEEAKTALRAFASEGRLRPTRWAHLMKVSPPEPGFTGYQFYYRGFVLALPSIADTRSLIVKFPVFANGELVQTLDMVHWTNKPEWVKRTYREKQACSESGESLEWYCIEFELPGAQEGG